jgi:hypothetical protein
MKTILLLVVVALLVQIHRDLGRLVMTYPAVPSSTQHVVPHSPRTT